MKGEIRDMKKTLKAVSVTAIVLSCVMLLSAFAIWLRVGNTGEVIEEAPFYSLQAAYNKELITRSDVKAIVQKKKTREDTGLDDEKKSAIEQAYRSRYRFEDVEIYCFGVYGNSVAFVNRAVLAAAVYRTETVAGVTIGYGSSQRILIWNERGR